MKKNADEKEKKLSKGEYRVFVIWVFFVKACGTFDKREDKVQRHCIFIGLLCAAAR